MSGGFEVLETGPLTTVQDAGRLGQGALGIGRSGACDRTSYRLANRLVGNAEDAAALEVTFGGLELVASSDLVYAVTGAPCAGIALNAPTVLRTGEVLRLGVPRTGLRTYVAIRGGVNVAPVLGSRSTDLLSGLGPAPLSAGDVLAVGKECGPMPGVDLAPVADPPGGEVSVRVLPGPRRDWFTDADWDSLTGQSYTVSSNSNRIGVRLEGTPLERAREGELPSEGMDLGALQIPPSGLPVLFLADHPVTGGYPVIGYVDGADLDLCAQLRPGQSLRFRSAQRTNPVGNGSVGSSR
ncbi:urea amidolyase related protein [Kribbella flavida DSM 17836]|uniref:Urea amidolyase related protein n=1 Tax=Kribbella flavida (strain DSM 17836 / JCM 10339 / NBRC 14399) TaxID=479435 RepID=D2PYI0_KRIFD|nr:biotin-dependent carboxyltransferase family protein [Kribbella flavida]ADB35548.1 urea amidolyase related protein [Kribbella flavida DSM 17836]